MEISVREHSSGFQIFTVRAGDSEFELSEFGGQLLSWTKAGVPILFANQGRAILDGATPYRGGAPICFPYFGRGPLLPGAQTLSPQHGRARTSVWKSEARSSSIVLAIEQASPDGFGPTVLRCELEYGFSDDLRIEARIANTGDAETPFQLAIHAYWACAHPALATVDGLGERFLDNLSGLADSHDPAPDAAHSLPFDRVYPNAADDLAVSTDRCRIAIATQGGTGAVLWNPGPDHKLADLGSPYFICVESGVIIPNGSLGAGEGHTFTVGYSAEVRR